MLPRVNNAKGERYRARNTWLCYLYYSCPLYLFLFFSNRGTWMRKGRAGDCTLVSLSLLFCFSPLYLWSFRCFFFFLGFYEKAFFSHFCATYEGLHQFVFFFLLFGYFSFLAFFLASLLAWFSPSSSAFAYCSSNQLLVVVFVSCYIRRAVSHFSPHFLHHFLSFKIALRWLLLSYASRRFSLSSFFFCCCCILSFCCAILVKLCFLSLYSGSSFYCLVSILFR